MSDGVREVREYKERSGNGPNDLDAGKNDDIVVRGESRVLLSPCLLSVLAGEKMEKYRN